MMTSSSIYKHTLPSTIESLAKVEQIIEEIKVAHKISDEIYGNILVSLSEAVNNAIKHGNKMDESKMVGFSFEEEEKKYIFTVTDQGNGFDFNNTPDPTHPDNIEKMNGRGIFIMQNLADEVEFENGGREIRISFNR